jgi:ABC-type ATPase involved in cell division
VFGRYDEISYIRSVIEKASTNYITVIPIVGIVGAGKTTLAKLVYNDELVKDQFERIWVWVSNIFDEVRVTREILDVVALTNCEGSPHSRENYEGVSNYTKLQEVLKNHIECWPWHTKFMLVLDDVNDSMDDSRWKDLLDALGSSCTRGNVIIVTTRNLSIAQRLATANHLS